MAVHIAEKTAAIPKDKADLLLRETRAFAHLAYILADGSPQVTPMWFDWDGKHILINTARGRVKDRTLRNHPKVSLDIVDPKDPYRYLGISGRVTGETEVGADEMIRRLNEKYHGNPNFPKHPGEVRVTYEITPDRIYPSK